MRRAAWLVVLAAGCGEAGTDTLVHASTLVVEDVLADGIPLALPLGPPLDRRMPARGSLVLRNAGSSPVSPLRAAVRQPCPPSPRQPVLVLHALCDAELAVGVSAGDIAAGATAVIPVDGAFDALFAAVNRDIAAAVDADRCCRTSNNCDGIGGDTAACARAFARASELHGRAPAPSVPGRPHVDLVTLRGVSLFDAEYARSTNPGPEQPLFGPVLPLALLFSAEGITEDGRIATATPVRRVLYICDGCSVP